MAGRVSVMKELHGLLRNADKLFDGQVEIVLGEGENEEEDRLEFLINITPNDGLYKSAKVSFEVVVETENYPEQAPAINCLNRVYHPNIGHLDSDGGDICVSLLEDDWTPEVGLDGCIMSVLFLFYNPQIDDALSSVGEGFQDWANFVENVAKSLRGEQINGYMFERLIKIDESMDDNIGVLEVSDIVGSENNILDTANVPVGIENILDTADVPVGSENILNTADASVGNENKEILKAACVVIEDKEREPEVGSGNIHSMDENNKENSMSERERLDNCAETFGQSQGVLQNIQLCDIPCSLGQTSDQSPAVFHGRLENDQSHESSGCARSCEAVQTAATSRSELANQSDGISDTPDPKNDFPQFPTNHNDRARNDCKNCSRFRTWCMKLKERFSVFRNRIRNRT